MRWGSLGLLVGLALTTLAIGCGDECSSNGDCTASQKCSAGACVPLPSRPPLPPAADAAPRDADAPDAPARDAAEDAAEDAGMPEAGPDTGLGPGDGGDASTVDAGPIGGTTENVGLIQVSEIATSTGAELRVFGRFIAYSPPAFRTAFVGNQGPCELVDRVPNRNAGNGFPGTSIAVSGFMGPFIPGGTINLIDAQIGIFEPKAALAAALLFPGNQTELTHTIRGGVSPGELGAISDRVMGVMVAPNIIMPATPTTPLTIGAGPMEFQWNPMPGVPGLSVAVEIATGRRDVLLRCTSGDTGRLEVPLAARQMFTNLAPIGPYRVELVYERTKLIQVPVINGPMIPTTLRHAYGRRYRGM